MLDPWLSISVNEGDIKAPVESTGLLNQAPIDEWVIKHSIAIQ